MTESSRRGAAIRRATRSAQRQMNRHDAETLRRLERIYRDAAGRLGQEIARRAGPEGRVPQEVLGPLRQQIERRLQDLASAQSELLDEGLQQGASLGASPLQAELTGAQISRAASGAVEFVQRFVDENGLQLSDRIWRLDRNARDAVSRAVESAVVQGHSASRAARDFLARGDSVPIEVQRQIQRAGGDRIARSARRALMVDDGNAYRDARRVFRTELNRAHGQAYRASAKKVDDVAGVRFLLSPRHPRRDICDMHAAVNRYGMGAGVYPMARSPWPAHPNTLSYEEVVFQDEVTKQDRDAKQDRIQWLGNQPPDIQEAVLNSRRKRVALQRGILTEGQIATPWQVLRDRYRRQGVDLDKLKPEPLQAQRATRQGQPISSEEAERYVLEQGRSGGVEHALVRDVRDGSELFRKTSNQRSAVHFTATEAAYLRDGDRSLEVVHNHPGSTSLSGTDLQLSTLDGVEHIVAAGHDASRFSGKALTDVRTLTSAERRAKRIVIVHLQRLVNGGKLATSDANQTCAHITNTALARAGLVRYELEREGDIIGPALRRIPNLDAIADEAAESARNG